VTPGAPPKFPGIKADVAAHAAAAADAAAATSRSSRCTGTAALEQLRQETKLLGTSSPCWPGPRRTGASKASRDAWSDTNWRVDVGHRTRVKAGQVRIGLPCLHWPIAHLYRA
jgi:hypothetical protein